MLSTEIDETKSDKSKARKTDGVYIHNMLFETNLPSRPAIVIIPCMTQKSATLSEITLVPNFPS